MTNNVRTVCGYKAAGHPCDHHECPEDTNSHNLGRVVVEGNDWDGWYVILAPFLGRSIIVATYEHEDNARHYAATVAEALGYRWTLN